MRLAPAYATARTPRELSHAKAARLGLKGTSIASSPSGNAPATRSSGTAAPGLRTLNESSAPPGIAKTATPERSSKSAYSGSAGIHSPSEPRKEKPPERPGAPKSWNSSPPKATVAPPSSRSQPGLSAPASAASPPK
jgi:hypothetical protein